MAKKVKKSEKVVKTEEIAPVGHDKIMAEIARLKKEEIDSGAWDIWKASQKRLGWDPDRAIAARPSNAGDGPITAAMFEASVGHPPERDDLNRCNCTEAGRIGHLTCGWCSECNMPRFLCPHPLSRRVTMTVPRRGR